jgi:thymidylate synthase ThyX
MQKTLVGGAKYLVVDDLPPEDNAMLQALYSRSAESAEVHLEKVRASGSGKFMQSYYVNYSHKSIADCGSTTVFLEGVSLLAAKAVQDWPLYCGQETSTRYINMSAQRIVDPIGTDRSRAILNRWMSFYTSSQSQVEALVRARYPMTEKDRTRSEEEKAKGRPSSYEGAVKARVFDSLRGFLPAGITTQLSWHTNLRQAGDHLVGLSHHPSYEIREMATTLREMLAKQYTSSGLNESLPSVSGVSKSEGQQAREAWDAKVAAECTYLDSDGDVFHSTVSAAGIARYSDIIAMRPRGSVLPHFLSDLGQITFRFPLDFGSFRDIQRHRNGVCRMPLLTTDHGFEQWYLDQLDPDLTQRAVHLLAEQVSEIEAITQDPVIRQYYTALGFRVPCVVTYALPAAVYVMEIRSAKTVHPTLRKAVHGMIASFKEAHPNVPLHVDMDSDDWDVRRGAQTIVAKT